MKTASAGRAKAASFSALPASCCLCGGTELTIRFPANKGLSAQHGRYCCTSFHHGVHAPIWRCRSCGLLFQWPRPDEATLLARYAAVEDPLYLAEKENRRLTFRRALAHLGPPAGRRLLDVGAYCGLFVGVAQEAGFRAEGIELSRWAVAQARAQGLVVRNESIEEHARSGTRYDLITMWDVVEHLSHPRRDLAACLGLLRRGGQLHLSTIDARSFLARGLGRRWPWLMEMHLIYFDRKTLPALLEQTGFRVLSRRLYTHTVSVDYLLRKVGASFPPFALPCGALRRLMPPALPIPVNLGDNMVVTAERP